MVLYTEQCTYLGIISRIPYLVHSLYVHILEPDSPTYCGWPSYKMIWKRRQKSLFLISYGWSTYLKISLWWVFKRAPVLLWFCCSLHY